MALVGTYDASTFVEGDFTTYPALPGNLTLYQPSMHWLVTVGGPMYDYVVVPGDLLFPYSPPRTYGDYNFGDKVFGGSIEGNWTVDVVAFLKWDSTLPPEQQPPYPNAGCPFTPKHGPFGEWAPGWRIVVDSYFGDSDIERRYGMDNYGDGVYGTEDASTSGGRWVDITQPSFHIEVGDGMSDSSPRVVVSEVVIEMLDPVGRWFDIAEPITWRQPQPGNALRVGLLDDKFVYHPLISAQIERVEDVHDGEIRTVSVRGFGRIMDLVVDVVGWQRPEELASTRFAALALAAGWRWGPGNIIVPPDDATLHADVQPASIVCRDEMDRTVQSCGWFLDSDRYGQPRVRTWPHEPEGTPLVVVDCQDSDPDVLVSHSISYANDQSALLNHGVTTNAEAVAQGVTITDPVSEARFGKRGRAYGLPLEGLAWKDATVAAVWVQRIVDRFAFITRHVESFEVDTFVDQGWLAVLADLDTGRALSIQRRGLTPFTLDGVAVGWRHVLMPGRWQSTVFVSTSTPSM